MIWDERAFSLLALLLSNRAPQQDPAIPAQPPGPIPTSELAAECSTAASRVIWLSAGEPRAGHSETCRSKPR